MPSRLQDTVARNTAFLLIAQVLVKLLAFVAVVVLANQLDVETFGLFNFVLAFASLFVPLADLGIDTFLVRELAAHPERHAMLAGSAIRLKLLSGFFTLGLILAGYALVPKEGVSVGLMSLAALLVVLRSAPGTISAFFRARQLMGPDSLIQVGAKIFEFLAITIALLSHASLWGLFGWLFVGSLVQLCVALWMAHRNGYLTGMTVDRDTVRLLVRGGVPFAATGISAMVYFHVDAVLLAYLVGEAETGLYRAATNIMFAASGFSAAVVLALFPMVAEQHERNRDETVRLAANAVTYSLLLALPMAVGGATLAGPLIKSLYRSTYAGAEPVLMVLLWWLPISFVTNIFGYVLGAIGRQSTVLRVTVANAIFNIVLNLVLIPVVGALGAAITTVATEVLGFFLLRGTVARHFGGIIDPSRVARIALASAPLVLLTFLGDILHVALLIALGMLLYAVTAFAVRAITPHEVRYLLNLVRRTRPTATST